MIGEIPLTEGEKGPEGEEKISKAAESFGFLEEMGFKVERIGNQVVISTKDLSTQDVATELKKGGKQLIALGSNIISPSEWEDIKERRRLGERV